MRLKALLISSSVFLLSCGGLPPKPSVTICVINYPAHEGICGVSDGETVKEARNISYSEIVKRLKASGETFNVPLPTMDKSVCFAPKEWEKVQNYIDLLVDYGTNRCGR